MPELADAFYERVAEVEAYLDLIVAIETAAGAGPPRIGEAGPVITAQHQRILCSTVFLQLYNLVEATVTDCSKAVARAAAHEGMWRPSDLSEKVLMEWVRAFARTNVPMGADLRLQHAHDLSIHLVKAKPVLDFDFDRGGGGSWDDGLIESFVERFGLNLRIPQPVKEKVKRRFRDNMGPMRFVMKFRNRLAHGEISFSQGGENVTATQLRELTDSTVSYLREMVASFETYLASYEYLREERRPA